jgi:hypothetical protein
MKTYKFTTEKTSTAYSAFYEPTGGGIVAVTGDTENELKNNALEALNLTLDYQGKKPVTYDKITFALSEGDFV